MPRALFSASLSVVQPVRYDVALPLRHEACYVHQDGDIVYALRELGKAYERQACSECGALLVERAKRGKIEQMELWAS